MNQAKSLN